MLSFYLVVVEVKGKEKKKEKEERKEEIERGLETYQLFLLYSFH